MDFELHNRDENNQVREDENNEEEETDLGGTNDETNDFIHDALTSITVDHFDKKAKKIFGKKEYEYRNVSYFFET